MDYVTKATNRSVLRRLAIRFRKICKAPLTGSFPVLNALEILPDIFPGSVYTIVEDDELPPKTMAQCVFNEFGGFTVEIKESVYKGAYEHNVGALRGFICHEMCHVFLFEEGFKPIKEIEGVSKNEVPAYQSVEWQAKALCAEVMVPYEESKGMKIKDIVEKYLIQIIY
ncbi:hypothetical protein IJT10_05045 [bacterium]|nr:hypothetical protein [bacterium]